MRIYCSLIVLLFVSECLGIWHILSDDEFDGKLQAAHISEWNKSVAKKYENNKTLLDLSNRNITSIHENAFFLMIENFDKISFANNRIKELSGSTFGEQESLIELDLSYNLIDRINKDAFKGLPCLMLLNLKKNSIMSIDENTFRLLKSLKKLYLNKNPLKSIGNNAFKSLTKLEQLEIFEVRDTFRVDESFDQFKQRISLPERIERSVYIQCSVIGCVTNSQSVNSIQKSFLIFVFILSLNLILK